MSVFLLFSFGGGWGTGRFVCGLRLVPAVRGAPVSGNCQGRGALGGCGSNPVPLVNIKIGATWVFIRPKMGSA